MFINDTLEAYLTKVKPINDELDRFLMDVSGLHDGMVEQIFDYLRKKYDFRDYVIGSIKFVPAFFAVRNEEWELFSRDLHGNPFSVN